MAQLTHIMFLLTLWLSVTSGMWKPAFGSKKLPGLNDQATKWYTAGESNGARDNEIVKKELKSMEVKFDHFQEETEKKQTEMEKTLENRRKVEKTMDYEIKNLTHRVEVLETEIHKELAKPGCNCEENSHCSEGICKCDGGYTKDPGTGKCVKEVVGVIECTGSCPVVTHAHCHERRCRCDIGYAADGYSCRILTGCRKFADTFTVYKGRVSGNNALNGMSSERVKSLEACQDSCLKAPGCVGADLYPNGRECSLDWCTWYQLTKDNRWTSDEEWRYSQRDCNWIA